MKNNVAKILSAFAFMLIVFGCKKNDSKGKLYLNLKDVNGSVFNNQQIVIFNFEFSHPDNEITNDRLLLKRKFVNCTTPQNIDTIELPEYTATKDYIGTFELAFKNGSGASYANPCFQNNNYKTDSLTYTFWLLDKNNVKSDSVVSPRITLKR